MPAPTLGSPTLLLVPTELELRGLAEKGGLGLGQGVLARCGFGPVAAAARAADWIARLAPRRVLLVGCAGSLDLERFPVGSAADFSVVLLDGVGAGRGETFVPSSRLGFAQWPQGAGDERAPAIEERLELGPDPEQVTLLTVCAASDSSA